MTPEIQQIRERWEKVPMWKAILWGNETYPFPLSIVCEDETCWIARDGTASSLNAVEAIGNATADIAHLLAHIERLEGLVDEAQCVEEVREELGTEWTERAIAALEGP